MTDAASLARALKAAIEEGRALFAGSGDAAASRRPAPDKWCAKEILGHLVDSAANNHRRFVMGQDQSDLCFDGYAQDLWVARQQYCNVAWEDLVVLWTAYNRHLASVIGVIADDVLQRPFARHSFDRIAMRAVPADEPSTLGYLVEDYIAHLRHHMSQIAGLLPRE
jgi:hypothetical protein